jgi:S-adenosylmethionine:tRNA ribosyltransferase-isomerase
MLVNDFDYDLPPELIAQVPVEPRHDSRLMVLDRTQSSSSDHFFYELPHFLKAGDLLILNNTRVIPARLFAKKQGGSGRVEVFLLKQLTENSWETLVRPGKRAKPGTDLVFEEGVMGRVTGTVADGGRIVEFPKELNFREWLSRAGLTPLPPYITAKLDNPERYQTIYSKHEGSVAAPTAGLHFTPELLQTIQAKGVKAGFVTLHVGIGTFRPVKTEVVEEHAMHPEEFSLSEDLAQMINDTKQSGGRVIAVGTTTVRVLESCALRKSWVGARSGATNIFIYPGYEFKIIDGLITNFHLPKSTLLMLVSALAGREFVLECYRRAVADKYRFFSFGDAMLIL